MRCNVSIITRWKKGFAERIHTPGGVRSLVEESHLMTLLRQLNEDGFNVDGPMAELTAHW
ncbi:hypothetical protein KZ770_11535 [Escherichia coli]|nr:hypothetical protein [Escherichia coli]